MQTSVQFFLLGGGHFFKYISFDGLEMCKVTIATKAVRILTLTNDDRA